MALTLGLDLRKSVPPPSRAPAVLLPQLRTRVGHARITSTTRLRPRRLLLLRPPVLVRGRPGHTTITADFREPTLRPSRALPEFLP